MMKRASLAGFAAKKDPPASVTATEPTSTDAAPAADAAAAPERRRGQTLRLSTEAWRQLKRLAVEEDKPAHDLLVQAVNALFLKHGLPPIAL